MNCEEALVLLSGHLDGQNSEEEAARLQDHLAQCPDCRRLLEDLKALDAGLLSLEEEPPADLCESVMEAIRQEAPVRKKKRRWVWPTTAAAAVLILLAGAGTLAAPKLHTTEDAAPQMARMMATAVEPEIAEPETADEAAGISLYSGTAEAALYTAAPEDGPAQALAEERQAPVVLVYGALPELDGLPCEALEDGGLLYTLETAESASLLWEAHPDEAVLYLPEETAAEVSYALLLP